MKQSERALLQERVRTLVLRHALEATLRRVSDLSGARAAEELIKLEHRIIAASRNLGAMPSEMALSTMVAVEDAITTIRDAFDVAHQRVERLEAATSTPQTAPLAA